MIETAIPTVAEAFDTMRENFTADRAGDLDASFLFHIGGEAWHAVVSGGALALAQGDLPENIKPTVTLTASADDWVGIATRKLNPQMAFMTGKLKVQGDLGLATRLQSLFLTPADV